MQHYLPLIWAVLLSLVIILYVLLDGFDLGVGIIFPWVKRRDERDILMSTVIPVWDGNETWLVLGGAFLYGAFPLAYSVLLPTLYLPILFMVIALILRGVSFEFCHQAGRSRIIWDTAFWLGSTIAAFCQGVILGTLVVGYGNTPAVFASHQAYAWLTPFSVMTGIAVIAGYGLLGTTWLVKRTVGALQERMFRLAPYFLGAVAFFLLAVSIWTPLLVPEIWMRWFSVPQIFYLLPLPTMGAFLVLWIWQGIRERHETDPFYLSVGLFIVAYWGFCISDFPYIVPRIYTIWDAAAPVSSLQFLLIGAAILLPVLMGYSFYAYHVFSGKVTQPEHY